MKLKNENKKILFISNMYPSEKYPSFGTFVKTNEQHLISLGHVIVKKIVIDQKDGTKIRKIFRYLKFVLNGFFSILYKKYDYIYVHYLTHSTIPLLLALPFKKVDFFINIHGDDLVGNTSHHKIMGLCNSLLVHSSQGIILPSDSFKNVFLKKFPDFKLEKIHISHSGGISLSKFYRANNYCDKKDFVFISRIEEGKGWEILLDAIKIIKENQFLACKIIVHVYGGGNQVNYFLKKIVDSKLEDNIIYHGQVGHGNVPRVFNDARFFIFPTERESLGLVLLESMACGTPAIVSDIEPLNTIANKESCFFFKTNDSISLSEKIINALNLGDEEYEKMCEESQKLSLDYSDEKSKCEIDRFLKNAYKS